MFITKLLCKWHLYSANTTLAIFRHDNWVK